MVILSQDVVNKLLRAIADPTRRAIVRLLVTGPHTVSEIVAEFKISQPAISKQLGILERAGLVRRQREGQSSRCRLEAHALLPALAWIQAIQAEFDERLYRIDP
jgi:DNA-binding transcriptional ArsR family regulator